MNLIDAIKSGRPFRLKGADDWIHKSPAGDFCEIIPSGVRADDFGPDEVISENWETQEPTVTITRTQFWKAFDEAVAEERDASGLLLSHWTPPPGNVPDRIARKLGLEGP